jgi:flagellar hook assembly protein FlgD
MRGNSCEDVSQFMTCPGGGSLKVTSPNGKEKWKTKKKYTIKWKKGKAGTYVKIQLLKKGKLYKTIAAKTKNDGKHAWRVPSTLVKSAAYKVKITSTKNKKLTDSSNNHFTITK